MVRGIVLAGGRGRRFGRPKPTVELDGLTLAQRAARVLEPHCSEVVIVGGIDEAGPLGALVEALSGEDDALVLACDLPLAAPVIARLARREGAVVAVDPDGRVQPLCARYPREAFDVARRLLAAGERRVTALPAALDAAHEPATADELLNVNTPEDLDAALRLMR